MRGGERGLRRRSSSSTAGLQQQVCAPSGVLRALRPLAPPRAAANLRVERVEVYMCNDAGAARRWRSCALKQVAAIWRLHLAPLEASWAPAAACYMWWGTLRSRCNRFGVWRRRAVRARQVSAPRVLCPRLRYSCRRCLSPAALAKRSLYYTDSELSLLISKFTRGHVC